MIANLKAVFGQLAESGEAKVLYIGFDAGAAEKIYRAAGTEYRVIESVFHVMATAIRYPAQEKQMIADQVDAARRKSEAEAKAKQIAVEQKRAAVQKALKDLQTAVIAADPEMQNTAAEIQAKQTAADGKTAGAKLLRQRAAASDEVFKVANDAETKSAAANERDRLSAEADAAEEAAGKLADEASDLSDKLEAALNPKKKK